MGNLLGPPSNVQAKRKPPGETSAAFVAFIGGIMVHLRFLLAFAAIIFFAVDIRFGVISPEFGVVMIGLLMFIGFVL